MSWPYKVVIFNTTPVDFLGFHLVTFLSSLSLHFLFTLHAYKSFIPYFLLHFLIKLIIDLCVFSCFLTSVSSICSIFLWFVECLLLFLSIPSSFPLCTSIHNSSNLTHLKKSVHSTYLFLGFKYCQKWTSKLTIEVNNFFSAITFFPIRNDPELLFSA